MPRRGDHRRKKRGQNAGGIPTPPPPPPEGAVVVADGLPPPPPPEGAVVVADGLPPPPPPPDEHDGADAQQLLPLSVHQDDGANGPPPPPRPANEEGVADGPQPQLNINEELALAKRVRNRLRNLSKRKALALELEKKQAGGSEPTAAQQERVNNKNSFDMIIHELENLTRPPPVPHNDPPNEAESSKSQKSRIKKAKRKVKLTKKELDKEGEFFSYSGILSKPVEDKSLKAFESFLTGFTIQGESESVCSGIAKSMLACNSSTMVIRYSHLEAHDKEMAMAICRSSAKLMPRLKVAATDLLHQLWVEGAGEDLERVEEILKQFKLQIEEMPKSHMMLKEYLKKGPKTEIRRLHNIKYHSPTSSTNRMVGGILSEVIHNHENRLAWNGDLSIDDVEVKDGSIFIISKSPTYQFDEVSEEVAGWMKADLLFVWYSVCERVVYEAGNDVRNLPQEAYRDTH